jgi:hypothetical protein
MAMKQNKHYKKFRRLVHGGTTRLQKPVQLLAEQSFEAPREQVNDGGASTGVLRMDKPSRLPAALAEAGENSEDGVMPSMLVITITLAAVAFIVIITWFISRMPAK